MVDRQVHRKVALRLDINRHGEAWLSKSRRQPADYLFYGWLPDSGGVGVVQAVAPDFEDPFSRYYCVSRGRSKGGDTGGLGRVAGLAIITSNLGYDYDEPKKVHLGTAGQCPEGTPKELFGYDIADYPRRVSVDELVDEHYRRTEALLGGWTEETLIMRSLKGVYDRLVSYARLEN